VLRILAGFEPRFHEIVFSCVRGKAASGAARPAIPRCIVPPHRQIATENPASSRGFRL
jgi:hypothetical protein